MMSLFAVQRAEGAASLVIAAAVVVAADGWWVFRNADDRPVATLPTSAVCAIDALAAGDAAGARLDAGPVQRPAEIWWWSKATCCVTRLVVLVRGWRLGNVRQSER